MPTRPFHRGARLVQGLLALVLLTALVAGIPWGLTRYIGWPLPRSIPTWPQAEALLLAPMSTSFLLNTLACVLWPLWAAFVIDVARAIAGRLSAFPHPRLPSSPLNALATALTGAILVALLAQRPTGPAIPTPRPAATHTMTLPTATSLPVTPVAFSSPLRAPAQDHRSTTATAEVLPPHNGVYDSLWRIAERALGDGARWPQIYALNKGRPQPDGRTLDNPNLIRPGWVLRLPEAPSSTGIPAPKPSHPPHANTSAPPAPSVPPGTPAPIPSPETHHQPGVALPTGAFVGIGLAALIATALITVRRRRRIHYRPGSGERSDLNIAPVVRALRLALDETARTDTISPSELSHQVPRATDENPPADASSPTDERVIGVKDGQEVAWNIARAKGLGLIGPGALDAVRALLVALLAEPRRSGNGAIKIVVPDPDAQTLLGQRTHHLAGLRIVADLNEALDMMETELITRTNTDAGSTQESLPVGNLVLVAAPAPHADRRLQAILDNGSSLGLAGILLGQWRPGGTAHIRADGAVATSSSSLVEVLTGARLFTLPTADAQALLSLLHEAQPTTGSFAPSNHHSSDAVSNSGRRRRTLAQGPAPREQPRPTVHRHPGSTRRDTAPSNIAHAVPPADDSPPPEPPCSARGDLPPPASKPTGQEHDTTGHRPLHLSVLGRFRLTHHGTDGDEHADLSQTLAPKQRELLAYLALHRDGARREALAAAIWPDAPRDRPYNSFHATVSQLRRALRNATHDELTDITVHDDGHYSLDHDQLTVDLWHLQDALEASHHSLGEQRHRMDLERVADLYAGDFAAGLSAEWIEAPREDLRRDVLDAVSSLVRILRHDDPEQALALLERARTLDRYNEAVYRDIARFQALLGEYEAISRTFTLLATALAEIDDEPSRETLELHESLRRRRPAGPAPNGRAAG
ncbi:MAG TPA: hypothetical protein VIU15_24915 [Streptomyces sp.]